MDKHDGPLEEPIEPLEENFELDGNEAADPTPIGRRILCGGIDPSNIIEGPQEQQQRGDDAFVYYDSDFPFELAIVSSANQPIVPDPKTIYEAFHSFASKHWKTTMQKELDLLQKYNTWEYADLSKERKAIGLK